MKLESAVLAAMLSAFALSSLPAIAAEEKPAEQAAEAKPAKPAAKKRVQPHSHAQEKSGTPSTAPSDAQAGEPKMPLHDHGKMHK